MRRRRLALAIVVALAIQRHHVGAQQTGTASDDKLTTVLADLASAVRPSTGFNTTAPPVSFQSLPQRAQLAARTGRLKIDTSGMVQVYLLLDESSPARAKSLTALGVKIEIADIAAHRIQAWVPVSK